MFLDVTLQPRKEVIEKEYKKPAYDWSYENSINSGRELIDLDSSKEFKYDQWRTNISLSNFKETIYHVNEMNINYHLANKMHYHFLFYSIRKAKRYNKKKTEDDKKLEKELKKQQELEALICDYYKYNIVRAREALKILTPEQIAIIKKKQEKGGVR